MDDIRGFFSQNNGNGPKQLSFFESKDGQSNPVLFAQPKREDQQEQQVVYDASEVEITTFMKWLATFRSHCEEDGVVFDDANTKKIFTALTRSKRFTKNLNLKMVELVPNSITVSDDNMLELYKVARENNSTGIEELMRFNSPNYGFNVRVVIDDSDYETKLSALNSTIAVIRQLIQEREDLKADFKAAFPYDQPLFKSLCRIELVVKDPPRLSEIQMNALNTTVLQHDGMGIDDLCKFANNIYEFRATGDDIVVDNDDKEKAFDAINTKVKKYLNDAACHPKLTDRAKAKFRVAFPKGAPESTVLRKIGMYFKDTDNLAPATTSQASPVLAPATTSQASPVLALATTTQASPVLAPATTTQASPVLAPVTTTQASLLEAPVTTTQASPVLAPATTPQSSPVEAPVTTQASLLEAPVTTIQASPVAAGIKRTMDTEPTSEPKVPRLEDVMLTRQATDSMEPPTEVCDPYAELRGKSRIERDALLYRSCVETLTAKHQLIRDYNELEALPNADKSALHGLQTEVFRHILVTRDDVITTISEAIAKAIAEAKAKDVEMAE